MDEIWGYPMAPWYPCFRKPLSGNFEQQKLSDGGRNDMELWSPGSYQGFKWAFQELMVRWAVFFDSLIVGLYVFLKPIITYCSFLQVIETYYNYVSFVGGML